MAWQIPLADIDFGPEESIAVQKVLDGRWLTMGAVTEEFEKEFASFVGSRHAIAVTNCTAALHLACLVSGLGPGDEVIVPSLSFVATANAVRYTGAQPVFADVENEKYLCLSPETIAPCLTDRTRAIIVMHYGGYPCDMPGIIALARQHNLIVLEDAAHAVGSVLDGRQLGTWGRVGCFSFFSNKNMTTGEGGMAVTDDDELAAQLRNLRSHGMTTVTWDRHRGHAWSYDVTSLGYNYRMDEIRSALGLVQLHKLDKNNANRSHLTSLYRDLSTELIPQVVLPFENAKGVSACHLMPVLLPSGENRQAVMEKMRLQGIQTSIHYPPIHAFQAYKDIPHPPLPMTEEIARREITLPLYGSMKEENVSTVVKALQSALQG